MGLMQIHAVDHERFNVLRSTHTYPYLHPNEKLLPPRGNPRRGQYIYLPLLVITPPRTAYLPRNITREARQDESLQIYRDHPGFPTSCELDRGPTVVMSRQDLAVHLPRHQPSDRASP